VAFLVLTQPFTTFSQSKAEHMPDWRTPSKDAAQEKPSLRENFP